MDKTLLKRKRIIPGFGLSMGVTIAMLSIIVLIPLISIFWKMAELSIGEFFAVIFHRRTLAAFGVSILCSALAALVNLVMGVLLAWVLVRYEFPLKRVMDGLIELPFALPTAIAGIALTSLTVNTGWVGSVFAKLGIDIAYTKFGIIIAMVFVGIPFVVRTVQPVLEKLDGSYEEAAAMLGAGRRTTFLRVVLPEIRPAALTGFGLAFARGLGEYGSVVFIAGNQPYKTEIASLLIMNQLQEYDYAEAAAIALVMLIIAFVVLFVMNVIQSRAARRAS
ncbi:MAG: sulfate ABC transporter permease subunit CysT [Oscillospiraceae bacterium]|nr:sulfate ABC transporter permease subunit CysT [Oscillospiraceae bacterium]